MAPHITASLIVPIFNGQRYLPQFWESLQASLQSDYELIVVNDASNEDVLATIPSFPMAAAVTTLINEAPLGYAPSVNRAMTQAAGEYLIHLNTDLILLPSTLRQILSALATRARVGVVGAKLVYPQTGLTQHVGMAFSDCNKFHFLHYLPQSHPLVSMSREVQATTGAILGFRRSLYEALGPMDESLYNCNEDIDYCLRARRAGYSIMVDAKAVAYHWEGQSGHARFVRAIENEAIFWGKWLKAISPDLHLYIKESIEHLLRGAAAPDLATATVINLSKGNADRYVLEAISSLLGSRRPLSEMKFLQVNNPDSRYWLPLLLPYSLLRFPSPFVYVVDCYRSLAENYYWFTKRMDLVGNEVVVDHTGCVLLSSDLLSQTVC